MSADPVVVDLSALQHDQQNHDVLVRFLDEVVTTADQTQHLQRIEVVDRTAPDNVLTSQIIPDGSAVKLVGDAGNDHVTLDLTSLSDSAPKPQIDIAGGRGSDTFTLMETASQSADCLLDGNVG